MPNSLRRTVCWTPVWNKKREGIGLEHLLLRDRVADSVVLAFDEERGSFRLSYHLTWDSSWRVHNAHWSSPEKGFPGRLTFNQTVKAIGITVTAEPLKNSMVAETSISGQPRSLTAFPYAASPGLSASEDSSS
jgi:hypothetical protein